jgi:hypothetical protein
VGVNPAALPIYPSPFGLEYLNTGGKGTFGLVKGQNGFGAGVATSAGSSAFFGESENFKRALDEANGSETFRPTKNDPDINLATAVNLLKRKEIAAPFGPGYKYNPEGKRWPPTLGAAIKTKFLNIGLSTYEGPRKLKRPMPKSSVTNPVKNGSILAI